MTWPQPSRISNGCVALFRILTPATSVTPPPVRGKHRYVAWIPMAPPGKAVETAIFVTSPTNGMPAWPTRDLVGRSLLGSLELVTGDRVSVLYRTVCNRDTAAHGSGSLHVLPTASADSPRSLAIGFAPDGSRVDIRSGCRARCGLKDRLQRPAGVLRFSAAAFRIRCIDSETLAVPRAEAPREYPSIADTKTSWLIPLPAR